LISYLNAEKGLSSFTFVILAIAILNYGTKLETSVSQSYHFLKL